MKVSYPFSTVNKNLVQVNINYECNTFDKGLYNYVKWEIYVIYVNVHINVCNYTVDKILYCLYTCIYANIAHFKNLT